MEESDILNLEDQNIDLLYTALEKKARRLQAKDDIEFFAKYYLPHILLDKTPAFHKEIRSMIFKYNRLGIAAPRGFAKSTNVQIIYAIYCLLFNSGEDILSISQSAQMAEDWVRKIKFELEGNEKIKADFGGILQWGDKDSKRWTADHLVIQQQGQVFSQIRARGRGCQVRGLRPTKVFCDDLEDDELIRSDDQRRYLQEWFLGALYNVLKSDQQLIVIGTILHPLSLISKIIERKDQFKDWETKKYKAIQDDGTSLWPARFPLKDLLHTKEAIGTYAFEAEFQNNPIGSGICLWRPEWIVMQKVALPDIKMKVAALDPAASEKEAADCSAISCFGLGYDGKIYEIETIKGRWGTFELIDQCIRFYQKHLPMRFGIEQAAFQSFMKPVLIKEARDKGIFMPVESISLGKYSPNEKEKKFSRDKYTRALSIIHLYEQDLVRLRSPQLVDQLRLFPTGSEDDMVDASVYALKLLMKYSPIKFIRAKSETRTATKSFVVGQNGMIPPLAPIEECFQKTKSWKI